MWASKEYRALCDAQNVLMERVTSPETSDKDLASLVRSLCMLVGTKLEVRQALKASRATLAFPVKESLLIEATPDGTGGESGPS